MSTNMYLRCVTHDPHIESDAVGGNLTALTGIREFIEQRANIVTTMGDLMKSPGFYPEFGTPHNNAIWWFLYRHPKCDLEIWDEYGTRYPLTEEKLIPPLPPVGDWVQLDDGGIFKHVEWYKFVSDGGYGTDWNAIGSRVISHGTIHWRDAMGGVGK